MISSPRYEVHRHQGTYYDHAANHAGNYAASYYAGHLRFGRVEKQLDP